MKKICLFCILLSIQIASGRPMRSMLGGLGAELIDELAHPLPDGVFAVEYIEATGTQYINTGIPYNSYTDEINCTIEFTEVVEYGYVFGCNEYINGGTRYFAVRRTRNDDKWQVLCAYSTQIQEGLYLNTTYHIRISPQYNGSFINELYFNSSYSDNYVYTRPLYLLAVNNSGSAAFKNKARLYHFSYAREGVLLLYLVPVKVDIDGVWVGAIYDLVSGELFLNNGTGKFLIGPDL